MSVMYPSTFDDSSSTTRERDEQIGRREINVYKNNDSAAMEYHPFSLTAGSSTSRKMNGTNEIRVRLISRWIIVYMIALQLNISYKFAQIF